MFRPMRRPEKALSDEATRRLLLQARRGVLAVNGDDGYPYACPVNYLYDPAGGSAHVHTFCPALSAGGTLPGTSPVPAGRPF